MLTSKPTGADPIAIANWEATNRMIFEIFLTYWKNASPEDLYFPGLQAGEDASYAEWTEEKNGRTYRHQGMRKPLGFFFGGGEKHGIVRTIYSSGNISEATFFEDEPHGLSFTW